MENTQHDRFTVILILLAVTMSVFTFAPSASGAVNAPVYTGNLKSRARALVPGQVIVQFERSVSAAEAANLARSAGAGLKRRGYGNAFHVLSVPVGKEWKVIDALSRNPRVKYAHPDWLVYAFMVPNDPLYSPYQWNLDNPRYGGIGMEEAWDINNGGSPAVIVAILDTGVAYENYAGFQIAPDLAGNTFAQGYDFINLDSHANDDQGHGTHVAGTVAQATNNGMGVAGIAGNTTIMPVKVLDANGTGSVSTIADGIRFATDNGAQIINMSLGVNAPKRFLRALEDAVKYANAQGVLLVAAAGNDGASSLSFPAAYNEVIAVAATTYNESLATYSNYGSGSELCAPGGNEQDLNNDGYPDMILQNTFNPNSKDVTDFGYWFFSGTSMAAPHVSGVAALLFAAGAEDAAQVRSILRSTADDLGAAGYDTKFGYGLINAAAALRTLGPVDNPPSVVITAPQDAATVAGIITVEAFAEDDKGLSHLEFFIGQTSIGIDLDPSDGWSARWDTTTEPEGSQHTITVVATDDAMQQSSDSITVRVDNIDDPPTVTLTAPLADSTVAGSITISAVADDDRGIAQVEFLLDGQPLGIDTDGGDGWSCTWSSATSADGSHTISAVATDTGGQTATHTIDVTVDNSVRNEAHCGDLDAVTISGGSTWRARVTVTVHDDTHKPVANAVVMASWYGGQTGTVTATTDGTGTCTFTSGSMHKKVATVTLSIYDIAHDTLVYNATKNHDPDGDSDGTSIVVTK